MAKHIVSIDSGNGGTTGILAQKSRYKSVYFPSVRAAATGDSLGLGKQFEMEYTYYDWNGHRYVVGDDVIRVTRRHLERHMGQDRYGNEFHQMLVAVALTELGIKSGQVDLTLFAPPGMYNELRQIMIDRFNENESKVSIQRKDDKKPRSWSYSNITVWPEGIGAAACFILDDDGQMQPSEILGGDVLILDVGAYTLDSLQLHDGNLNPEALQHATWANEGVHTHVREPILRELRNASDEFQGLAVDDIDKVIRLGFVSDDYTLNYGGMEVDLKSSIDRYRERYAEWIANNVVDGNFAGLRGFKSMILVGGGAVMVADHLKEWYGDKLTDPKKHATTRKVHPVDMNAVGGLRLALMRQK